MNRRDFFGRAAALSAAIPAAIVVPARAPAQLRAPDLERPTAPPPAPSSPAPGRVILGALTPYNAIRTVRELHEFANVLPGAFTVWNLQPTDYFRAIECFTLVCVGRTFTAKHIRRLQVRTFAYMLADAPGEIFQLRSRMRGASGSPATIDINFEGLIDARRLESDLSITAELVERCKPERIRVFVTHWIGGTR